LANTTITNVTSTNLSLANSLTFLNATGTNANLTGAFYQTGFTDCSNETQTVLYNATTGKFTCGSDATGGVGSSAFTTAVTVTDGSTTSSLRADGIFIATTTANLNGLFFADSSGNVSASGSLRIFGSATTTNLSTGLFTFTSATGTNLSFTRIEGTSITSTNLRVSGPTSLGNATSTNFSTGLLTFTSATATNLNIAGAFYQTGFTDCSSETQTVLYNATTGQFSCGLDGTSGSATTAFTTAVTVSNGSTTSSLRADGIFIATSTANKDGLFFVNNEGDISASGTLFVGTSFGTTFGGALAVFSTSTNGYGQVVIHNDNNGANASSDFVATADNGTDSTYFIDMGINSSGYSDSAFSITGANDGYLYVNGGDLALGTATSDTSTIMFHIGGTQTQNAVMRMTTSGFEFFRTSTSAATSSLISFVIPTSTIFVIERAGSTTSTLMEVKDLSQNFGAAVTAGAFINRNSYLGEEYNVYRRGSCNTVTTVSTSQSRGDFGTPTVATCAAFNGSWSLATSTFNPYTAPTATATGTRALPNVQSLLHVVNGIERLQVITTAANSSTGIMEYYGGTAGSGNYLWATNTLPLMTAKVRPNIVSSTTSTVRYWVGMWAAPTATQAVYAPTSSPNGIFFTNCKDAANTPSWTALNTAGAGTCNSLSWIGMVKNGNSIATTSCEFADPYTISSSTGFNFLRIEFVSSSAIRFMVDSNTANGVDEVSCGAPITVNPASYSGWVNLMPFAALMVFNPSLNAVLDIDYMRVWQDENEAGGGGGDPALLSIPEVITTTPDLVGLSSLGQLYPAGQRVKELPEGTLVSLDLMAGDGSVTSSLGAYDTALVGVIIPSSGLTLTNNTVDGVQVTSHGRASVRVSTMNGPINFGDYLTASPIPGVAMRATKAGTVLGRALATYVGEGESIVPATISVEHYTGKVGSLITVSTASGSTGADLISSLINSSKMTTPGLDIGLSSSSSLSEIFSDSVVASLSVTAPTINARDAYLSRLNALSGTDLGVSLDPAGKFTVGTSGTIAISFDALGNATYTGEITAKKFVGEVVGMNELQAAVLSMDTTMQNLQAQVTSTSEVIARLQAEFSAFMNPLATSSVLTVSNLSVSNTLQVAGLSIFNNGLKTDTISSLGDILTFMNDVSFFGRPYFNVDTAGFAVVASSTQSVDVVFDQEYLEQPIVNVTLSLEDTTSTEKMMTDTEVFAQDIRFVVTKKSVKGFTIVLNKPASAPVTFSWTAFAVKNPKIFISVPSSSFETTPQIMLTPTDVATSTTDVSGGVGDTSTTSTPVVSEMPTDTTSTPPASTEPDPAPVQSVEAPASPSTEPVVVPEISPEPTAPPVEASAPAPAPAEGV
jgi:hypothetical protein